MKKLIFIIFILGLNLVAFAQSKQTKYFKSEGSKKEVSKDKAKISESVIQNIDGTVTTEVIDLSTDKVLNSQTFKGEEPYGVWKSWMSNGYQTSDYDFPLIYSEEKCEEKNAIQQKDFFQDENSIGYIAPKIKSSESNIYKHIYQNIRYPAQARKENIQGTVFLTFDITKEGTVENIIVRRGLNVQLDKEAVRVLRQLLFSSPPTLNGQPITMHCIAVPIKYKLE